MPIFQEDIGNYGLISLTSILGKTVEQIHLKVISKRMQDKKMTGH